MKEKRILIIDDERALLESLEMFFSEKGYAVECALTAAEGLEKLSATDPHVVILDVRLPDMNGLDLLQKLPSDRRRKVIIVTAFHDMDTTIQAIKWGAFEYIPKPIDVEELEGAVQRVLSPYLRSGAKNIITIDQALPYEEGKIIGKSKPVKEIFKTIGVLCENRVTVLIEGETGTGKELIARAIHNHGSFRSHPFRAINCSAIPPSLLESELFGHEQGAFTGASHARKGKFELAGEGSIFLDEVGEIPFELQSKLLRFLQEKEFERIGGEKKIKSAARVIAATNRDLWKMVQDGTFREDLYYRLSVAVIRVPPVRERRTDIPNLVDHVVRKLNHDLKKNIRGIEKKALRRLAAYDWPGNVRELENVLTHAVLATRSETILDETLVGLLEKPVQVPEQRPVPDGERGFKDLEKEHILKILEANRWHLGKTCDVLGVSRPTLRQKMAAYGISREKT